MTRIHYLVNIAVIVVAFDFTTPDALEWEIQAVFEAIDHDTLAFSRHASNEMNLDALTRDDVIDTIQFYDGVSKDLPDNDLNRAPGLNFTRELHDGRVALVKVGWNERMGYYVVITAMATA